MYYFVTLISKTGYIIISYKLSDSTMHLILSLKKPRAEKKLRYENRVTIDKEPLNRGPIGGLG